MKLTQIEGKSPHKKGSAKYKKHMAAKHASMGEKVENLKGIIERAKQVKAKSKKPKVVPPNTGHQSEHPYQGQLVGEENIDEISMQDIKKGAKVAALTGAIGLGGAGIGKIADYMNKSAYDYSIQLPQLEMYLDYAEQQKDQRMIKQLKNRIRSHEVRISTGSGDVAGSDGTPMSFEVVYDKENPDFDPLGDPMDLNAKFAKARDAKNESKQPNPVAKHSRNKSGAGAHKSPKDYDRNKMKTDIKKELKKTLESVMEVDLDDKESDAKNKEYAMDLFQKYLSSAEIRDINMMAVQKAADLYYKFKEIEKRPGYQGKALNHKQAYDMALANLDNMAFEGTQYSADKATLVKSVIQSLEKKAMNEKDVKFLKRLASLVGKKLYKRENGALTLENKIPFNVCPKCGGDIVSESDLLEAKKKKKAKQDACYHKVKSRYKVWPSAYASGALVQCRKKGAKNWGNKSKK